MTNSAPDLELAVQHLVDLHVLSCEFSDYRRLVVEFGPAGGAGGDAEVPEGHLRIFVLLSAWRIWGDGSIVAGSRDEPHEVRARIVEQLAESSVVSAKIDGATGDLAMVFSSGARLELLCTSVASTLFGWALLARQWTWTVGLAGGHELEMSR